MRSGGLKANTVSSVNVLSLFLFLFSTRPAKTIVVPKPFFVSEAPRRERPRVLGGAFLPSKKSDPGSSLSERKKSQRRRVYTRRFASFAEHTGSVSQAGV